MACFSPITAYQQASGAVVFAERGDIVRTLQLPCGGCVGCRLERARQWSIRCVHEASLHRDNCFVTLTYEDDRPSLWYPDFQGFMRRLRLAFRPQKIRFFMAGEYGAKLGRPHYHALLFGVDFADRVIWSTTAAGSELFRSARLESLWTLGYSSVGELTRKSCAYVARYCTKKVYGQFARAHYEHVDGDGVITDRVPEFCRMSLKPGIGEGWMRKWKGDVSRDGRIVVDGRETRVPRYYEKFFDQEFADDVAQARYEFSLFGAADRSDRRLRDREEVAKARLAFKKRELA